jgi:hypothetical protein
MLFAATLAARNEYAPIKARGQVFIWVGILKIAAGSAGTAVAGATIAQTVLGTSSAGDSIHSSCCDHQHHRAIRSMLVQTLARLISTAPSPRQGHSTPGRGRLVSAKKRCENHAKWLCDSQKY